MKALAEPSVKLGSLAHALQKERGMSTGFLGSKGAKFANEILAQRSESDRRRIELREKLKGYDTRMFCAEIETMLSGAGGRIFSHVNAFRCIWVWFHGWIPWLHNLRISISV